MGGFSNAQEMGAPNPHVVQLYIYLSYFKDAGQGKVTN